jgi:hypothetical protein
MEDRRRGMPVVEASAPRVIAVRYERVEKLRKKERYPGVFDTRR